MPSLHTAVAVHRSLFLLALGLFASVPLPAAAQSVDAVIEPLRAKYQQQLETVDTYVVETTLYTSYHRKVMRDGAPTYESATQLKGSEGSPFATSTTPSDTYDLQLDRLQQHATYVGTETIDGVRCHVLRVDEPEKVNPDMGGAEAETITYYIDAEQFVPVRLLLTPTQKDRGPAPSSVIINMHDYQTTDGLTLPHRMEFQVNMDLSEEQRRQMEQALKQMETMPAQQRRMMEKMMGDQMDMMKQMMGGDPIVVEVLGVEVNTEIPDGVF